MKTILYNPIFINPQAYYVFPRLTRYLQPDNESTAEPANYIGTIEVKVIAYGDTTLKRTYTNTDSIDLSEFKNTWIRISLFTKVGSCVLGEWKIGNMESDLPYIDPEVLASLKAVVIVGNKTNNDSDRAIVKNLVDPDNPFVISNASFKLNSGFGKYEEDFTSWIQTNGVIASSDKVQNSITGRFLYFNTVNKKEDVPSFKVNITLGQQSKLQYNYIKEDGTSTYIVYSESGIYTIPASYFSKYTGGNAWFGFYQIEGTSTIEQIPSFEGAFVTDGIDDLITSTKTVQEMLGGSNEITVVSMMANLDSRKILCNSNYSNTNGYNVRNTLEPNGVITMLGYTDKNGTTNNLNLIMGDKDSIKLVDKVNFNSDYVFYPAQYYKTYYQVAWYWTIIANKVLTTDQINQVIAYFNLDRTLNPDILCNTIKQGITNENHAEFGDKLIDFSGNGRDIQLNNIAWKGDSGIGKYEVDFLDSSIWNSSNSTITSSKIDCKNAITHIMLLYYSVGSKEYPDIPSFKVIKTGADIDYSYIDETGSPKSVKIVDGMNILPASHNTLYSGSGRFCGFGNPGMGNSVTITQIPSHAGALCLDGVNDFGKVTGMPIYKDYTVVADYIRTSAKENAQDSPILSKSQVVNNGAFVFNYLNTNSVLNSYSFGTNNGLGNISDSERKIYYQSKYVNNGKSINSGTGTDYNSMWLGTYRDTTQIFFDGAIYSLMSFPYSMSEFLIERQLKKHKLGTLYPDMVEFRPVIKSNIDIKKINYWDKDWNILHIGDYVSIGNDVKTNITVPNGYKVSKVTSDAFDNITIEKSSTEFIYDVKFYGIKKSPQKIGITIEQDENYVLFNPVINSNYDNYKLTFQLREYEKLINIGDYIPKGTYIRANLYLKNNIDELVTFTFNGVNIDYAKSPVLDTAYNIRQIYNYDSPQEVNITIDEYIRYEDIVQPYPVLLRFNDENGNEVSWGGKFRVGSTITRIGSIADPESNLLNGLYSISGLSLNGKSVTSSTSIVEKRMVFKTIATYLLDNNEPKCILSPRLLRIPNSSYKILGYIPDISGHGNHGKINNSAYAEGSGVNEDGSYQFDGVDDFVTIPTLSSGGKQVLMKVNWDKTIADAILYDQRGYPNEFAIYNADVDNNNNPVFAYQARNNGQTYIDGILNKNIKASELRAITHNITITNELSTGTNTSSPVIGSNRVRDAYFTKMALYDFMLFDNISTDDKIKELNEYVGIEAKVELPPYYWDAYGKTNLDEDKATIQQRGVAIGDYDLINNNFAYEGMSGYNGYPAVFGTNKTYANLVPNDGNFILTSSHNIINVTKFDTSYGLLYSHIKLDGKLTSRNIDYPSYKIKVTGLGENFGLHYSYLESSSDTTVKGFEINNDGIYIIPKSFASDGSLTSNSDWIGFIFTGTAPESCNVTIEVLPEYENGLVYDGVTDYSENANIPAFTDYTYIFKRTLLNKKYNSASVFKGSNQQSGGGAFICDYNSVEPELMIQGYSFGAGLYANSLNTNDIVYGTKNSVNGAIIVPGNNADVEGLAVGKWRAYRQMVFYKLILYPKTISLLQINFLKNLMERDEIIDLTNPIFIQE